MPSFRQRFVSHQSYQQFLCMVYQVRHYNPPLRMETGSLNRRDVSCKVKNNFEFLISCSINQLANPVHTPVFSSHNVYPGSKPGFRKVQFRIVFNIPDQNSIPVQIGHC